MLNIVEIVKAWAAYMNPTEEQEKKAEQRLEICNSCEHKGENLMGYVCSLCGCPFKSKVFGDDGGCPEGKW